MSTPTTATILQNPHHFSHHYTNYEPPSTSYIPTHSSHPHRHPTLDQHPQRTASRGSQNFSSNRSEPSNQHGLVISRDKNPTMPAHKKAERKPNWDEFYKNGKPSEVIMIHDDTPESQWDGEDALDLQTKSQSSRGDISRHAEKRRRVGVGADTGYSQSSSLRSHDSYQTSISSKATVSSDSTNSSAGSYSTSATSYSALSSGSQRLNQSASSYPSSSQVGQKRKRSTRDDSGDEGVEVKPVRQQHHVDWPQYHAPPKPPIKAKDVSVRVVQRERVLAQGQKIDDEDGHYIVVPNTELTKKYTIVRLLGQGTFGKVVEAIDRETGQRFAIKIIRAVPKYRDASRIELRVLDTLAQNDRENRNRCIHLRECFDYMNHICIVTDLLSQSVFDFLKNNEFVPFPSSHIQKFAWQLFTSVAFLHDLNLIHTDLKPENILLVDKGYQTFTYNRTIPSSSRGTARTAKQRRVLLDTKIRLIDFGSATFEDEYHSSVVSTRHYRAPEIILNLGWSFPCDIWSIGCILVEFFTGDALFQTHDNLEHLAMMEAVCDAKIPRDIIEKVRAGYRTRQNGAAAYFRARAYALDYPQTETSKASKKYVKGMKKLSETIPPNAEFNKQFLDLLQRIFVYDPKKRISAHEALKHPWFHEKIVDDGTEADKIRMHKERSAYR